MRVAVLGLGEAGSLIAADLAASGAEVAGFDPAEVVTPAGLTRARTPGEAVGGADLVVALTAAADASTAMAQARPHLDRDVVYADMATASPGLEAQLAATAEARGARFADVALMAPVPGRGLATPALASGTGAEELARMLNPLGAAVEAVDGPAGRASSRKLLRSVVTKGLAALLVESMEAAASRGESEWLWGHLVETLSSLDEPGLRRLVEGTGTHAARRLDEMHTVEELLTAEGVSPHMTKATIARLGTALEEGLSEIPGT